MVLAPLVSSCTYWLLSQNVRWDVGVVVFLLDHNSPLSTATLEAGRALIGPLLRLEVHLHPSGSLIGAALRKGWTGNRGLFPAASNFPFRKEQEGSVDLGDAPPGVV